MKRLIPLLLLCASVCLAEEATLQSNAVMRSGNSLVILKAGTVVQIVKRNEKKTISVKVNGTGATGLIPASALEEPDDPPPLVHTQAPPPAPTPAAAATPPADAPAAPRKAQTMYGKAVEKARENAASHEKTLVQPTDEILGGK
jgi:hypothetical protein